MSLKSCYPYFKIHDFRPEETYVMGLYDTCSYQSPQGRQVFGVCCNNTLPDVLPEEPESEVVVSSDWLIILFTQHFNPKYKPYNFGIIHSPEEASSVLCPQSVIWFISHCLEGE